MKNGTDVSKGLPRLLAYVPDPHHRALLIERDLTRHEDQTGTQDGVTEAGRSTDRRRVVDNQTR
jgi:hypothetical protein